MAETRDYLDSFAQLSRTQVEDEYRSLWRQGMATLARATVAQQPVPLEGINPELLRKAVSTALHRKLFDDLDWLSPAAAAAAIYELAAAIPMSQERKELGRRVLIRLNQGNATTFVVLATLLAADSRRALSEPSLKSRIRLALELPTSVGSASDALALTLISRPDLRREWLIDPSYGSLPSRRNAARILERAARETVRRAALGDEGGLRLFEDGSVKKVWRRLLNDRESLVWRHVAVARGLLSVSILEYEDEIDRHLKPDLSPTEWRRASVSLAASVALNPVEGLLSCQELLESSIIIQDPGIAGTMVFGLARAADSEPETAEKLLNQVVRIGGLDIAESLVELRRDHPNSNFGNQACQHSQQFLHKLLSLGKEKDDGRIALCESLLQELLPKNERNSLTLRDRLDTTLVIFVEQGAAQAHREARAIYHEALLKIVQLERDREDNSESRRSTFRAMRELDIGLLENTTLGDLLNIGTPGKKVKPPAVLMGDLLERFNSWLLRIEENPIPVKGPVEHLTYRLRHCRTLLHLIDADGSFEGDLSNQRRKRRIRTANVLFRRAYEDATTPLKRVVCASLARMCDALIRDNLYELSDVFIATVDSIKSKHDYSILAEASMTPDFQEMIRIYQNLVTITQDSIRSGRQIRSTLNTLEEVAQNISFVSTLRVNALRLGILRLVRDLEDIASAVCLDELVGKPEGTALERLRNTVYALAQLTAGSRWRLGNRKNRDVPACSSGLRMLDISVAKSSPDTSDMLTEVLSMVSDTLRLELPGAIAEAIIIVLERIPLVIESTQDIALNSFVVPSEREEPLPPWLPPHRMLGGFYIVRTLGIGGVGSVFVVKRIEERHDEKAESFALKVPDYDAKAARTLSEDEFLKLFREEAGALLSLPPHKNLSKFVTFDAGARPKPILVTELVPGPTLERVIERGELDMRQAFDLLSGIGAGLSCMHNADIAHLDVKPSNVILRQTTSLRTTDHQIPVLVDFGLAGRHLRPGCATGPYGAPEIWGLFSDDFRHRPMLADSYAYACLAFEVLTGQVLFQESDELATINSHLSHDGNPEKLLRLRKNGRLKMLCDLISHGLRQHPDNRISVDELRDGFRELRLGLDVLPWPLRLD